MMFRVMSYLLYAAVSIALYTLIRRRLPTIVAFGAAALFAVHPLHVEAVAVAVNQSELWVGLLSCLAVSHYLGQRDRGGPLSTRHELYIAGLFLAACLFKESALMLPGFLVAAEILLVRSSEPLRLRVSQGRRLLLLLMLVAVGFFWVRTQVLRGNLLGTFIAEGLLGLSMGNGASPCWPWSRNGSASCSGPRTSRPTTPQASWWPIRPGGRCRPSASPSWSRRSRRWWRPGDGRRSYPLACSGAGWDSFRCTTCSSPPESFWPREPCFSPASG